MTVDRISSVDLLSKSISLKHSKILFLCVCVCMWLRAIVSLVDWSFLVIIGFDVCERDTIFYGVFFNLFFYSYIYILWFYAISLAAYAILDWLSALRYLYFLVFVVVWSSSITTCFNALILLNYVYFVFWFQELT